MLKMLSNHIKGLCLHSADEVDSIQTRLVVSATSVEVRMLGGFRGQFAFSKADFDMLTYKIKLQPENIYRLSASGREASFVKAQDKIYRENDRAGLLNQ